jgi:hypothetical protein
VLSNSFLQLLAIKQARHALELLAPKIVDNDGGDEASDAEARRRSNDAWGVVLAELKQNELTINHHHSEQKKRRYPQLEAAGKVQVDCWLSADLLRHVDKLAQTRQTTRSNVVEQAVEVMCDEQRAWWNERSA